MKHKIIAISGALEENSPITNILIKCSQIDSPLSIELVDIKQVPLLNVDLFKGGFPPAIEYVRKKVQGSDGLLFAVPEFFGKVSPAFKNIFDWLSYSPNAEHPAPIRGRPVSMISVGGQEGTSVQKHLLQMSQFSRLRVMGKPCLHYPIEKMDSFGKNTQSSAGKDIEELSQFLQYFAEFVGKRPKQQ